MKKNETRSPEDSGGLIFNLQEKQPRSGVGVVQWGLSFIG